MTLEAKLAGVNALDERLPLGLSKRQGGNAGVLRVSNEELVSHLRDLNTSIASAAGTFPPCGHNFFHGVPSSVLQLRAPSSLAAVGRGLVWVV